MRQLLVNSFTIPELRNKILFTLGLLLVYRIGYFVPLPGVDTTALTQTFGDDNPLQRIANTFAMFTGGSLTQSSIFALGIMPYISAAIIFQLLATVVPALEKLQKEGQIGYKKIQEYTRYATVGLALLQSMVLMRFFFGSGAESRVYVDILEGAWLVFWVVGVLALTSGTVFLMWLGEQIDEYGIGNGISLIIAAGIVGQIPGALGILYNDFSLTGGEGKVGVFHLLMLAVTFVLVVAGAAFLTQGQRRIGIQHAKQFAGAGRSAVAGKSYLPLRVNQGGVMPIIFASSLMLLPVLIIEQVNAYFGNRFISALNDGLRFGGFLYVALEVALIYFFAYFWTTIQFRPRDIANNLRDQGSFIPGLRPGKRTSDYLETVMERCTYVGAGFLAVIAIVPLIVQSLLGINYLVASFLGGTGLLIVVSVALDLIQRIEAQMAMRRYGTAAAVEGRRGPGGIPA